MTRPSGPVDLGIAGVTDAVEIGAGGFGVVYRADEIDLGRTVAVKVLSGNLDEDAARRFERERRAMGTLSGHPNIVTIYRGGYAPAGNAYLVMEYLARGSLTDRLKNEGPLPWADAVKLAVQVAGALETAHRAGVLHRDIKPGNILISGLGNAKLADFGIARLQGTPETRSSVVTASLAHAPPDIISGHRPDARSDVYSLASTLLELVSGSPPFVRPTDESMLPILARIAGDAPPRPTDHELPAPVFAVVEKAMAKEPADRYESAAALGEALMQAQQQLGGPVTPLPIESYGGLVTDTGSAPPVATTGPTEIAADSSTSSPHDLTRAAVVSQPQRTPPMPPGPTPLPGGGNLGPSQTSDSTGATPGTEPAHTGVFTTHGTAPATPSRPAWLPLALGGAVLAVLGVLGAVLALTGGDEQAADPDDGTGSSVSAGDPADGGDPVADGTEDSGVTTTSVGSGPDDYATYVGLTDPTGSISVSVPSEWTDVIRGPGEDTLPVVAAAPVLEDGFFGSFDQPGVSVELREGATDDLDSVLNEVFDNSCLSTGRSELGRPLAGKIEYFQTCGETSTRLFHVVLVEPFEDLTAVIRIQAVSNRDAVAAETIVNSIALAANF